MGVSGQQTLLQTAENMRHFAIGQDFAGALVPFRAALQSTAAGLTSLLAGVQNVAKGVFHGLREIEMVEPGLRLQT